MTSMPARPNAVLSNYPLSQAFKDKLAEEIGADAVWFTISELRQLHLLDMVSRLRARRFETIYLPVEADEGRELLAILQLISAIAPSRHRAIIDENLVSRKFGLSHFIISFAHLFCATLLSWFSTFRIAKAVSLLGTTPRSSVSLFTSKKVFFLNSNLWFGVKAGGSVGHISGVVNGFLDLGYPVSYASVGGSLLVRPEAEYISLKGPKHFGLPAEYNHYRFHFDVVRQVERLAEARDAGFIYQRMSICNFAGVELSRRLQKPLVLEYNGSEAWVAKNWGSALRSQALAERCEEVALRHAHLVVTISDVLRDELLERGVPAERIVSYPNCIDPEIFDPGRFSAADRSALRARYSIPQDALVVTFVGTFGQWHGAPVLAQAVRILLEQRADLVAAMKLHFLFVGDGIRMPEVKAALGQQIGSRHVTMTGLVPQKEAPAYLAASDILSSPHIANTDGSRFFGSPTKLFEYMAMGKAIIASDLEQIGEVLRGSVPVSLLDTLDELPKESAPALLARPGSAEDIVSGLIFLAQRPEWRIVLGNNARALALKKYTWSNHVQAILERARHLGLTT